MNNFWTRLLIGLAYVLLIAVATLGSYMAFIVIFAALSALCLAELCKLLKFESKWMIALCALGVAYVFYHYGSSFYSGTGIYDFEWTLILPVVLVGIAHYIIFFSPQELAFDSSKIIFVIVYLALPFGLSFTLMTKSDFQNFGSLTPLFMIFVLIWCSDTFAYLVGKKWGKTPLSAISQKKTWEGYIGGVVCTMAAGVLIEILDIQLRGNWIMIALLVAIFAPLGDLAESKLKRIFGVKDSSNWLPGHGGFLDRLDSFLLTSPIMYLYYLIYNHV